MEKRLVGGNQEMPTNPTAADPPRRKVAIADEESSGVVVAIDGIVAVIGILCSIIIVLGLATDTFAFDEERFMAETANTSAVTVPDDVRLLIQRARPFDKKLHALLEGTVGSNSLISAIAAKKTQLLARKALRERRERQGRIDRGELRSGDGVSSDNDNGNGEELSNIDQGVDERHYKDLSSDERSVFEDDASFYVSIAQFKDILCPLTIIELYEKARNPRRVFAGIVDQRDNHTDVVAKIGYPNHIKPPMIFDKNCDGTCFPWYMMKSCGTSDFCPTDNIRIRHSWPKDGKGPTWGRYYAMLMYQGESYFMMIDSHSRFAMHWDMHCVLNLQLVPKTSKKAVLSHYPGAYQSPEQLLNHRFERGAMMMCHAHYTKNGIIRMNSRAFGMLGSPHLQPFSAGGFVVGDAKFVHEVPFDPYLFYVFDGEEILYSVRLWTHGFDMFTPMNNILFHNYGRHKAPRFWSIKGLNYVSQQQLGQARVKYFMQSMKKGTPPTRMVSDEWAKKHKVDREEKIYGLGKERSLEAYYKFAGVDPLHWNISFDFCRNLSLGRITPDKYHRRGHEVKK